MIPILKRDLKLRKVTITRLLGCFRKVTSTVVWHCTYTGSSFDYSSKYQWDGWEKVWEGKECEEDRECEMRKSIMGESVREGKKVDSVR